MRFGPIGSTGQIGSAAFFDGVRHLAMLVQIEPSLLDLLLDPQSDHRLDHDTAQCRAAAGPQDGDENGLGLLRKLRSGGDVDRPTESFGSQNADQQGPDQASDAMHAKYVQRVIVTALPLYPGAADIARAGCNQGKNRRTKRRDESCRRGDHNQASQ